MYVTTIYFTGKIKLDLYHVMLKALFHLGWGAKLVIRIGCEVVQCVHNKYTLMSALVSS